MHVERPMQQARLYQWRPVADTNGWYLQCTLALPKAVGELSGFIKHVLFPTGQNGALYHAAR